MAGSIAVFVHWYNGNVETERFTLGRPRRCSCAELPERLQLLEEDHVLMANHRSGPFGGRGHTDG
jgi:hypothetical protein